MADRPAAFSGLLAAAVPKGETTEIFGVLVIVAVLVLAVVFSRLFEQLSALRVRLVRQQRLLLQVAQKLGVERGALDKELADLLRQGERKQAMSRARETLGLSTPEAYDYLDTL